MINGLKELRRKISQKGFEAQVNKSMKDYVKKVVSDAKSKAPSVITFMDDGASTSQSTNVGSSIFGFYKNGVAEFDVADPQGPYIEFGTGRFAAEQVSQYSKEWQDLAFQFYENGKGTLMSYPYMYPAITENEQEILKSLEKNLND